MPLTHTCASHLVMAGVDIATVRDILRHKTIERTLRYAHLSPDHRKAAIEALGNALAVGADSAEPEPLGLAHSCTGIPENQPYPARGS